MDILSNQSPIIIAGMHRSGTSLITNLVKGCGVFFGKKISSNSESVYFQSVNRSLLDLFGCGVLCIDFLPSNEFIQDHCNNLKKIFKKKISKNIWPLHFGFKNSMAFDVPEQWGWKDPRNTLFLPIYKHIFPNARVIGIFRDEKDIAISLVRREEQRFDDDFKYPKEILYKRMMRYIKTARDYNVRMEQGMALFKKRFSIRYEDFVSSPEIHFKELLKEIQVPLPCNIDSKIEIVENNRINVHEKPESKRYIEAVDSMFKKENL
jgi:hypothetical protein